MLIFVFYCLFQVSSEGEILTYECEELDITTQAVDDEDEENAGESEWEKEDRTLFIFPIHFYHRFLYPHHRQLELLCPALHIHRSRFHLH